MSTLFSRALLVGATMLVFVGSVAAQGATSDELARKINGKLEKAIEDKDLNAVMNLVDVPWIGIGAEVIRDKKELRATFKKLLDGFKGFRPKKDVVDEGLAYAKFREKYKLSKEMGKRVDELKLMPADRVVIGPFLGVVLVRIREGKAKIVGVLGD